MENVVKENGYSEYVVSKSRDGRDYVVTQNPALTKLTMVKNGERIPMVVTMYRGSKRNCDRYLVYRLAVSQWVKDRYCGLAPEFAEDAQQ